MKRNITLQLDEDIVHKAKVLAARRATSVSRMLATEIDRLVGEDEAYRAARREAVGHLARGFHLGGGPRPDRASLHDR